jgi:acyl transferase domain-containing protein
MTDPSPTQDRLRRALDAIRTLKARVRQLEEKSRTFAIVGASCRLPGSSGLEGFDDLLVSSRDPLEPIPEQRWSLDAWYDENPETKGRTPVREGGFIHGIDLFDASYFGIAPREARVLDPQHRLLLEVTIEALEHAGVTPSSLAGTDTGVFLGISTADHRKMLEKRPPEDIDAWVGTGNVSSTAAGRLSYLLDLQGPSLALDTACSSSLVAVHLACQSLASGESSTAIAGGVHVLLDPTLPKLLGGCRRLRPLGRCWGRDPQAA